MDYSLMLGIDKLQGRIVVGIIDYIRQYTWDKQVEFWVKSRGIIGRPVEPTIMSPGQYSKRFRTAMIEYLTVVPYFDPLPPEPDPESPGADLLAG